MKKTMILILSLCFTACLALVAMAMPKERIGNLPSLASASDAEYDDIEDLTEATPSNASAAFSAFQSLDETEDFSEIKLLSDDMLEIASNLYDTGELSRRMTKSDIDFDKAVKIYMDRENSLLNLDSDNVNELISYLETAEYIWEVPVDIGKQTITYTLNIGKGLNPETEDLLTEDQKNYISSMEGKWFIVRTAWGDVKGTNYKDYITAELKTKKLSADSTYVLIGGLPEVNYPLALEIESDHMATVIPACIEAEQSLNNLFSLANERSTYTLPDAVSFELLKQAVANVN